MATSTTIPSRPFRRSSLHTVSNFSGSPSCPDRKWSQPSRPAAKSGPPILPYPSSGAATFASIYTDATLNAKYVDYAVRGQGEETLLQLLDVIRGTRSPETVLGLSYKDKLFGMNRHNPERPMQGPDTFPWSPFHRLPVEKYLRPSFFGKRTAAHHASIGCPFRCSFCGVHAAYGNRELMESPERTAAILHHLKTSLWCRLRAVLRHELLHARGSRAGTRRTAWSRSTSSGGAKLVWM